MQNDVKMLEIKIEMIEKIEKTENSIHERINCLKIHFTEKIDEQEKLILSKLNEFKQNQDTANHKMLDIIENFLRSFDSKLDEKVSEHAKKCLSDRKEKVDRLKSNVKFVAWLVGGIVTAGSIVLKLLKIL